MSFMSSKGNILCRLINLELYKIFAILNRAIKGLHCMHLGILLAGIENGGIDLDHQGHLAISTQKTEFNVALVN